MARSFLLSTYLLTQILAPFYASLLILGSVLFLANLIPLLEVIIDYGIGIADFIRLYTYLAPQLLLFTIPMASMMGVILGATRLNNDGEIMVLKSCGIGLYRLLPSVLIFALCTAALTGFFSIRLIPTGSIAKNKLLYQLAKERIDKGLQAKRFSQGLGDVVLYANRLDPEDGSWEGVYVSDLRDREAPATIMAGRGRITTSLEELSLTLTLTDGSLHRARGDISQTLRFERYHLTLPIQPPAGDPLAKTGKAGMNMSQLKQQAASHGLDTKTGADLLREYHKRLVLPVSCFILTLLGFPLGLMAAPGHRTVGIPIGLAVFILYYILLTAAEAMSEGLVLPVPVAMWLPNLIFLGLTLAWLRSSANESTTVLLEKFYELVYSFGRRLGRRP